MAWRGRFGGAALLVAAVQLVIIEAVAASAWTSPPYSYATNYISDLGVAGCPVSYGGRTICSPLAPLMNLAFVVEGLLFIVAAVVLVGLIASAWRWVFLVLAMLHGLGSVLIGVFPETSTSGVHVPGAVLAIAGGDLAVITAGVALRHARVGLVAIVVGLVGLAGAVLLETTSVAPDGILERVGVYAVTAFELLVGSRLLAARRDIR